MKPNIYNSVFRALKEEIEERGYDSRKIKMLIKNYSWFLSEYSLLRALLRSKLPIDKYEQSMSFLIRRHEILADEVNSRSTVLDIGCGLGILACILAKKYCQVYGIDIDGDSLKVAKRLSKMLSVEKRCVFQKAESNTLPFETSTFDYVILSWTLHDIKMENRELLLSECIRVLKPCGRLLILDPESQLNFRQVQETLSKYSAKRIQQKALQKVYDHGAFTDAVLAVYQKVR
jgi:ubiquinone/menaquinone biosynthesis C-methylase UbiE